jgi:subtilase family serine protease
MFARRDCKCLNAFLAGALLFLLPGFAAAQGNVVRPRITDRVDDSRMAVLQGNTHPLARPQFDQGAAPPNLPMDRMMLVLKRSAEQETALQDLLEQQQDNSSPNFHKWLTPDQFGQQFGPADQDIQIVTSWLASRGFQSIKVSKGRTVVEFSGTAAQVESGFHTAIHKYTINAEDHWANVNDPQIPAALVPVISGVLSLHNFPKKPLFVRSGRQGTAKVTPGARPQVTFSDNSHGLAPADFAKIYNINSGTMTGAGTTIGVIARSNINVSDVSQFRAFFGLPTNDPQVIVNGPDPGDLGAGDEVEAVLDATWPGAVAPSATVKLVVSEDTNSTQGVDLSEMYIIDNNLADVMTESFSACEAGGFTQSMASTISLFAEQAAAQGITYLVASGDGGPDSCDDPSTLPANPVVSVNILASTPFTVAVGGTQFNDTANPNTYWKSANDPTTRESVISYIPENVWNESCSGTCPNGIGLWSSGGGQSTFFLKPPWQSGVTGIPTANSRFVPDVSVNAADHDGYVLCITASCQNPANASFNVISGTSASAQAFGGIMALVVQQKGRQGQANYVFYKLAANEATSPTLAACNASNVLPANPPNLSSCVFNDVTVGKTDIPGKTGFPATVGYDEATGLGSVNVTNLISKWSTAISNASTTTFSLNNGTAVNITHGQSVPVNITVAAKTSGLSVVPVGDVSLIASTSTGGGVDGFTLDGTGKFTGSTSLLPGSPVVSGNPVAYNVTAHYAGDVAFLPSDSIPVSVIVRPEVSTTTATIIVVPSGTPTTSVAYGSPYVLEVDVASTAAGLCNSNAIGGPACPTGTVTVKDGGNLLDAGTFTLNSLGFFEDQPIQLPAGIHSMVAVYSGDNSFTGSTSATDTVTVTKAATTTTVLANHTSVAAGASVTLTATVNTQSNATASPAQEPSGMMNFFLGGTPITGGSVTVIGGVNPNTMLAQATASITVSLANGQDQITAQYAGDSNYAASAVSAPVTVSVGVPGINVSPTTTTINIPAPGQSGTQLITVTAANGFTGAVTLSCAVTSSPSGAVSPPTCSFGTPAQNFTAPNIITLSSTNTSGNATMTVASTAAKGVVFKPASRPQGPNLFLVGEVGAFIACFFLLGISAQKRRSLVLLAMAFFAILALGTGCGNSNGGSSSIPATTVGAYTVTVTATPAGATAQTTAITVNVQ